MYRKGEFDLWILFFFGFGSRRLVYLNKHFQNIHDCFLGETFGRTVIASAAAIP